MRYALRRLLQLIPTLFGVIVITFILFNVVGGSPASLTLGKNVSPRMLEDFDEERGFNKPLFFGFRTSTRAYAADREIPFPPSWRRQEGAAIVQEQGQDPVLNLKGTRFEAPLLFALSTNDSYRWTAVVSGSPGSRVEWEEQGGAVTQSVRVADEDLTIQTPSMPGGTKLVFKPGSDGMKIRRLRLDRKVSNPFDSQFYFFLKNMARLDFGESIVTKQPVMSMMAEGIGPSLMLAVPIFTAELLLAIVLALLCAYFRNTWIDRWLVVVSVILMSVNYLVWIVAGQYVFAYQLQWFPIWGFGSWRYLLLPILIGTFSGLGTSLRFYRTVMLDEMYRDYVRTAFAKGLSLPAVLFKHVLKNAMIPILTNVVMAIPFLYTGNLLLESFFGIPGLGYLSVNALNSLDVDVVRAVVVIATVLYIVANLISDLCYALVDPRVRLE